MATTVPHRVSEFFSPYPITNKYPWQAGNSEGLVTQAFLCSDPMVAMAFLSLNHARYDLETLRVYALGHLVPKHIMLPKSKITLLFDNDLIGKLWDIKIACLIRNKPVKIYFENRHCAFKLNNRSLQLPVDQISLSAFEKAAGIRTGIKTAKAKGHTTFLQQLIYDSS